jgi:hypothetical protein
MILGQQRRRYEAGPNFPGIFPEKILKVGLSAARLFARL